MDLGTYFPDPVSEKKVEKLLEAIEEHSVSDNPNVVHTQTTAHNASIISWDDMNEFRHTHHRSCRSQLQFFHRAVVLLRRRRAFCSTARVDRHRRARRACARRCEMRFMREEGTGLRSARHITPAKTHEEYSLTLNPCSSVYNSQQAVIPQCKVPSHQHQKHARACMTLHEDSHSPLPSWTPACPT